MVTPVSSVVLCVIIHRVLSPGTRAMLRRGGFALLRFRTHSMARGSYRAGCTVYNPRQAVEYPPTSSA